MTNWKRIIRDSPLPCADPAGRPWEITDPSSKGPTFPAPGISSWTRSSCVFPERILQEQSFERVGGGETIKADVRVIAATNRDLEARVASGEFRGDLFYRLNVFTIRLPPLRERGDDVLLLARHFLKKFNRDFGKQVRDYAPETFDLLRRYGWPGNIRELQSTIKQALLESVGPVIVPDFVPAVLRPDHTSGTTATDSHSGSNELAAFVRDRLQAGSTNLYAEALCLMERVVLKEVLQHADGNLSQAARTLGITRPTLRSKLADSGLAVERTIAGLEEG